MGSIGGKIRVAFFFLRRVVWFFLWCALVFIMFCSLAEVGWCQVSLQIDFFLLREVFWYTTIWSNFFMVCITIMQFVSIQRPGIQGVNYLRRGSSPTSPCSQERSWCHFFTIIDFISSDFPSVTNQWSVGSHGPYPILKKIRRIHQLHGYDSIGLLIAVRFWSYQTCEGEAVGALSNLRTVNWGFL